MAVHATRGCAVPDCPACERIAEDRAEPEWDSPADQERAIRRAEQSYERQIWGRE